ncbi:MAG: hypothetical protein P4L43_03460 [Syntrophobacteraceae bacterium]|nr:hypothetical protein [Syntrophobacteraceae bacterium]
MYLKCPVCKKEWNASLKVARHIFGNGDKAHRAWVNSQGVSFTDLLIRQATGSGNQGFMVLAKIVESSQDGTSGVAG